MNCTRSAARTALSLLVIGTAAPKLSAQDDTVAVTRHILALDLARLKAFERNFDMFVLAGDSATFIGERTVSFQPATLPDSTNGWQLREARTGSVAASETLILSADVRPVSFQSQLGPATLTLDFLADSAAGSATMGASSAPLRLEVPPDLILSGAMLDVLMTVLPLSGVFADSVSVLRADVEGTTIFQAELAVVGEELAPDPAGDGSWLVALRSGPRTVHLSVSKANGAVLRLQQSVPAHVGTIVEYRLRDASLRPPE